MQQLLQFITWRLFTAQHVSGVLTPIIRSSTTAVATSDFNFGAGRPDHDRQHCYHHAPTAKPEAFTAVVELLMMVVRTPETCWAVYKRQVINLRNCCIWLVDLFEMYDDTRTCKLSLYRHISFSSSRTQLTIQYNTMQYNAMSDY